MRDVVEVSKSTLPQRLLLALSLLGVLVFGGAYLLSFLSPPLIERAAREIVRIEIERRVGEKIDSISNSRLTTLAQRVLEKTDADIALARAAIRAEVPQKVASAVAAMLNADCECRKRLIGYAKNAEDERLASLSQVKQRLEILIESTYASVTNDLVREFRIFTASNGMAFALLALLTVVRRRATLQLCLIAAVLVGAVGVTGGLYLFNQDWLHTIVFGEYIGMAYIGYLAGVAFLLADVVFNRARVTTMIVDLAFQAIGKVGVVTPC